MLRALAPLALIAAAVPVDAQHALPDSWFRPVTGPVRDAGILHLATGTWTRKASTANLGPDIIYNNSCYVGYFRSLRGNTFVDEGRIPSTTSPINIGSRPGCADRYTIDGFQIGYCTDQMPAAFGSYTINFFQSYAACASVIGVTPTAGFVLSGLPAASPAGPACWTVNIDLVSPPQSASLAFSMLADGDGSWTAPSDANLFGWSMSSQEIAGQSGTGPLFASDLNVCGPYDGTRWDDGAPPAWPANLSESGTGMGTLDVHRIESGPWNPGCYFFSSPFSSFHLELYADDCAGLPVHASFCFGDGASGSTPCPCANHSTPPATAGCVNSMGVGARVRASGPASLAADMVLLAAGDVPPGASMLFFQGTVRVNGGAGIAFGDGLQCAGGAIVRIGTKIADAAGSAQYPEANDPLCHLAGHITAPGVRTYQVWYRNVAPFCTSAAFNLTNGTEIAWGAS